MRGVLVFLAAVLTAANVALAQSSTFVGCYLLGVGLSFTFSSNQPSPSACRVRLARFKPTANADRTQSYCFGQGNLYAFYSTQPAAIVQSSCYCTALQITSLGLSPTTGSQTTCSGLSTYAVSVFPRPVTRLPSSMYMYRPFHSSFPPLILLPSLTLSDVRP